MSASVASDSSWWDLVPDNVLQNVLQHLDLPARLGPASLVCQRWFVARLCDIQLLELQDSAQVDGLLDYLWQHGNGISRLNLAGNLMDEPEDLWELSPLPCDNLRDLELSNLRLLLAAEHEDEAAAAGVLSAVTGLTRLSLANAVLIHGEPTISSGRHLSQRALAAAAQAAAAAAARSFKAIQRLTGLQELSLSNVTSMSEVPTQRANVYDGHITALAVPGEWLAALSRLSKLELVATAADPRATLQHISRLTGLQQLKLAQSLQYPRPSSSRPQRGRGAAAAATATTFAGLGRLQRLTSLELYEVPGSMSRHRLKPHRGAALGQGRRLAQPSILTALQRLELVHITFAPALLAGMTQLTHLLLSDITWEVSPGDFPPGSDGKAPPAQGRAAYKLLQLLPSLQQLRRLMLDIKADDWPQAEEQLPAYSALTANPRLEHLDLQRLEYPLPAPAWKHIFRNNLQLPAIAGLNIRGIGPESCGGRVLGCFPAVEAGFQSGRSPRPFDDSMLERRALDPEEDGVTLAQLRLLEVYHDELPDLEDEEPPGVPAVLGALTHLEVVFRGEYHGWGVHGCSEDELRKGNFGMQRRFCIW